MSDQERRITQRIDVGRSMTIEVGGKKMDAEILNISFGGVLLRAGTQPEVGETVTLHDEKLGAFDGQVVRHVNDGFALFLGQNEVTAKFAMNNLTSGLSGGQ
ncbi:MAG: PilZ domain-containing protein [Sphingomonadales bacterium]|nr:PilZ domain-containing protein [Sphingomonadales bacterium]